MSSANKSPIRHSPSMYHLDILRENDMFAWFLLCYFLGKPIQSTVAVQAWRLFLDEKLDTPWAILEADETRLADALRRGKYAHYQHIMAGALHKVCMQILEKYDGSLVLMLENSANEEEFRKRLLEFYGVGPVTARIVASGAEEYFAQKID